MTEETTQEQEQAPETPAPAESPVAEPAAPTLSKDEIDRLTRENADARQNIAALWGVYQNLSAQGQPQTQPQKPAGEESGPPRREQYTDDFLFLDAQREYHFNNLKKELPNVIDQAIEERRQREAVARRDSGIREHVATGRGLHHDFDHVIRDMPIDDLFIDMVGQFNETPELPAEITYRLGKDKKELQRIMNLPPARRAYEIGKVADKVRATAPAQIGAIEPVQGHGATPSMRDTTSPASDKLSDKDWRDAERARMREKMGG